MDIDVKNSLDNVLLTCNGIFSNNISFKNTFAKDIYSFICTISKDNSNTRFDYFSKVYLNGEYKARQYKDVTFSDIPVTLTAILNSQINNKTQIAKVMISFFLVLGRYYATSKIDKKDVELPTVTAVITKMNDLCKTDNESSNVKAHSAKTSDISATEKSHSTAESKEVESKTEEQNEPEESLEELMEQLNSLIGMNGVKNEVQQIINLIKVQKKGEEFGVKLPPLSLHLVFYGNPGTGKTTVARLLSKIYKCLGVLSSGQLIEKDRSGLVAGYVGQTAIKTQEAIDAAMGGILFIDEAYTLTHGKGESDFGQEAVDTILKAMEDHRDDFIVIVAGYPDLMKEFIASNPGLKSRFNQFINFEDYTPEELVQIFKLQCRNQNLILAEECDSFLREFFQRLYDNRAEDYANGRDVRNYFERVIKARANRLSSNLDGITFDEYVTITINDLQEAEQLKTEI